MKHRLLALAATIVLAATASSASAAVVDLTGFTFGNATVATVQSTSTATPIAPFSVYAGQYSGTLDGRAFVSYCVELTQSLYFNTVYTDYRIVSGIDAWGATKSAQFDHLISFLFGANVNSNVDGSGLAQAAVWETLYETLPSNSFATGSFRAAGADPMLNVANATDWSFLASVPVTYHVDLLHSPSAQDLMLIRAAAVPEPSDLALLFAGALALGVTVRRRSGRAASSFGPALQ